ncbi:MAG: ribonuclease P protein subunit [Promethearchaeia archaeon]
MGLRAFAKLKAKASKKDFRDIGIVINESKNMLITQKDNQVKRFIKKDHIFRFIINEKDQDNKKLVMLEVNGEKIVGIPINRLRLLRRKRWYRK